MEIKCKRFSISALVMSILALVFFVISAYLGINAMVYLLNPNEGNNAGEGLGMAFVILFFIISLIPTLIFSISGIALCIYPLKNKYQKTANIAKLVFNILIIVICFIILLFLILKN